MHARLESDQLDDAVDQFEANWGEDSFQNINVLLKRFGIDGDMKCVAELVRVDIQRRYTAELQVDLKSYFDSHRLLFQNVELSCLIAYEDYRTRVANSLPVSRDRWDWIAGVKDTDWYRGIEVSIPSSDGSKSQLHGDTSILEGRSHAATGASRNRDARRNEAKALLTPARSEIDAVRIEPADLADAISDAGFTAIRQISAGAFSRVFLVTQDSLANRYVVVKAVLRAFREADRLAQLQHTNIVPIYSYHRSGRWSLICMPYTGLITLADYFASNADSKLRSGQSFVSTIRQAVAEDTVRLSEGTTAAESDELEPMNSDSSRSLKNLFSRLEPLQRDEFSLWMFSHLTSALAHAHARNILHGDLKPANILLRNDGEPALLDFNLSAELDGKESTSVGGTLHYMAPELMYAMIGAQHRLAVTSDIYSLGAVYYQFLTGRPSYPAPRSAAPIDLEYAISERREPLQWQVEDCVSPGIREIVTKCLAYAVDARYQTAEQLHEDIERERNLLPLKYARESSLKHRFRKWVKRHPLLASVGTLSTVSVAIVACLSVALWQITEHRRSLVADTQFTTFDEESQQALAGLLVVGRREREQAVERVDQCLAQYGVLTDSRWQERSEWQYLDQTRREIAERRLTDLLLRTAWVRHDHANGKSESQSQSLRKDVAARATLLNGEPFTSHAPLSIQYLHRMIEGSPAEALELSSQFSEDSASPLDILGQASQSIERLDFNNALRLLTPNLLETIDPYTYWVTLGRAQLEAGYLPSAELSFSMAIELFREAPAAFHYRGVSRMRMRSAAMTTRAIADFSSALQRVGHAYETRISLAMSKENLGDLRGAIEDLESLSGVPEIDAQALIVRSRIYRKLRDFERANRDFDAAIQIPPRTVSAWQTRALARLPHDAEGAIDDLRAAEKLSPNSVEVLQNLAHVYSEHLDAPEKAIDSLTSILRLNPTFERALLGRAVLLARSSKSDRAIKDLQVAESSRSQLTPAAVYQAACVHSLVAREHSVNEQKAESIDNALVYLSRAVQQGYGADLLATDPDLDPLRGDERFRTIVSAVALGQVKKR